MADCSFRVLVVDDDPDVALYTSTVLERRGGCTVLAITDPTKARTAVDEFRPDVVVTDIEMPGMTGLELIAQLRADQPDLPVVVMTAHISVDYAVGALRSQADEFLTKPIASPELIAIVQRLATSGRTNREAGRPREYVLAIGAHPDDVELGVGGILAAHRDAGDTVVILTMSRGARGGAPDDRQNESLRSADLLGARLFLEDLIDTEITNTGPTIAIIERVIRQVNPSIVYTHSIHDRHQDHRAVHEATIVAARSVDTVACYQSPSATVDFRPSRFVSIDGYVETKLQLLAAFHSQAGIRKYLEPDFVTSTARYWSRFSSTSEMCEPLEIIKDADDLSVQSRTRPAVSHREATGSAT
ncbi:MAG TPA: response regulator [Galbitalea sp.]|jgi:LmbE family N-acetylglucosaminyl deacetylase